MTDSPEQDKPPLISMSFNPPITLEGIKTDQPVVITESGPDGRVRRSVTRMGWVADHVVIPSDQNQ